MHLVSPFRDFYDVGLATGYDESIKYIRTPVEVEREWGFPYTCGNLYRRDNDRGFKTVTTHIIGFCGKIYPMLEITAQNEKVAFCKCLEDVDKFVEANYREREINEYFNRDKSRYWKCHYWAYGQGRYVFTEFFDKCQKEQNDFQRKFEKYHCPVFVASCNEDETKIVYNGCLKDVQFFRYFDPITAYQEVFMWLANQAVPMKPIPKIDDKTMVGIKGFDKFSFRKDKSKK